MKKQLKTLSVALTVALGLGACGGEKALESSTYIPANAEVLMSVDLQRLISKSMTADQVLGYLKGQSNEDFEKVQQSGIDLSGEVFAFGQTGWQDQESFSIIVPLNDSTNFRAFAQEYMKNAQGYSVDGFAGLVNGKQGMVWNDKVVLVNVTGKGDAAFVKSQLSALVSNKTSLLKDKKKAKELMASKQDIALWLDLAKMTESAKSFQNMVPGAQLSKYDPALYEGSEMTATLNFEKGKVVLNSDTYGGKALKQKLGNLSREVDGKFIKEVPGTGELAFLAFAVNPKELYKLIEEEGGTDKLDETLGAFELTSEEVFKAISGDFLISLNALENEEKETYDPISGEFKKEQVPGNPQFSVGLGVKDAAVVDKVLKHFQNQGLIKEVEGGYTVMNMVSLTNKNGALVATGMNAEYNQKVLNGEAPSNFGSHADLMEENGSTFYVNLATLLPMVADHPASGFVLKRERDKEVVRNQPFQTFTSFSKEEKKGVYTGTIELTCKDQGKNSLVVLQEWAKSMQ